MSNRGHDSHEHALLRSPPTMSKHHWPMTPAAALWNSSPQWRQHCNGANIIMFSGCSQWDTNAYPFLRDMGLLWQMTLARGLLPQQVSWNFLELYCKLGFFHPTFFNSLYSLLRIRPASEFSGSPRWTLGASCLILLHRSSLWEISCTSNTVSVSTS